MYTFSQCPSQLSFTKAASGPQFFPPLPFAPGLHLSQSKLLVLPFFFFLEKEVVEG